MKGSEGASMVWTPCMEFCVVLDRSKGDLKQGMVLLSA